MSPVAANSNSANSNGADNSKKEADNDTMAAIGVTTGGIGSEAGELLVTRNGGVIGILEPASTTASRAGSSEFMPASLFLGVSSDLERTMDDEYLGDLRELYCADGYHEALRHLTGARA